MDFAKLKKYFIILVGGMAVFRILIYYHYLLGRSYYFYSDDAIYAALAKRFLNGDFMSAFHPYWNPGFPLATVPFYLISKSWENAQFLVSATAATLLIFVLFWFYKRFSIFLSLIIAFLAAVSIRLELLVVSGGMTEPLYILLLWIGIFFSWLALQNSKKRHYVLAGIFLGLAYFTRTEAMVVFSSFLFIIALQIFLKRNNLKEKILSLALRTGLVLCFFFLINAPYIIFQSLQLGRFTLSGKYAFYGTGPFYALEKNRPSTLAQDVWSIDYMDSSSPYFNPARARTYLFKNLMDGSILQDAKKGFTESLGLYQSKNTSSFFVGMGLYIALIGFVLGLYSKKFRGLTLYLTFLWLMGIAWVSTLMQPHYRYLVYALPFFFYLQGLTIYFSGNFFVLQAKKIKKRWLCTAVLTLGIILPAILLIDFFVKNANLNALTTVQITGLNKDHKLIGEWLKSQKIDLIGGRMEAIPFYADAKLVYMPSEIPEEIVKYMKKWGVEYLIARPREVGYAHVVPIADPKYKNLDLTLFKQFDDIDGTLIWKVNLTNNERLNNERLKRNR